MNSSAFLKCFPRPARSSASPFKVLATIRSSSSIDLNLVSGVLTVFAIIWDRQMFIWILSFKDFCWRALSAHSLHDPDLLLREPVKLVDQGVDLPVNGLDAALQCRLLVGRLGLRELFMQSKHLLHQ